MNAFLISTMAIVSILITGCNPMKSAEDAAASSAVAATNSGRAADAGESIKDYTEHTMEAMKTASSLEIREKEYEKALEADDLNLKTSHASTFFQALGFQAIGVMDNTDLDLAYTREKQKADAVKEFVKKMGALLPKKLNSKNLTALNDSNKMQTLYAFAATMHEISMTQTNNLINKNEGYLNIISFYDIVTTSLKKIVADRKGLISRNQLSLSDKEVLREADKLIYILKLRAMILPVLALGRMSNIQESLIVKIKMLYSSWTMKADYGAEQTNYINDIFDRYEQTKSFLSLIGENVTLDKKVVKIYKNLKLNTDQASPTGNVSTDGPEEKKAKVELENRIQNILK